MVGKSLRYRWFLVILCGLLVFFFLIDLLIGSVNIPLKDLLHILSGGDSQERWQIIVLNWRLPRSLTAILVGAGLSLAGLMMQTLFRNPLAGPFVLGISSGASLGVALLVMASVWTGGGVFFAWLTDGQWPEVIAAVTGSGLIMLLVILVSMRLEDPVSILIIGIMFGSITGAVVSVLQYFSDPVTVHRFLVWTFGSISGVDWTQFKILAPLVGVGMIGAVAMQKPLNAMLLGENQARTIGISVKRSRILVILVTSLLAGVITAFAGPIAFVGVAVPHIARSLLRSSDHRTVAPVTILCGSILMLICDVISQMPGSSQVLPINSVTALFGAPVVIWVIVRSRKGEQFYR